MNAYTAAWFAMILTFGLNACNLVRDDAIDYSDFQTIEHLNHNAMPWLEMLILGMPL